MRVIPIMLFARKVENVYYPPLLATFRLKRRFKFLEILTPLICLLISPQHAMSIGVRSSDEWDPLQVAELQDLEKCCSLKFG